MTVFTVRHAFFDTDLWSPAEIVGLYKSSLKAAGFSTNQMPSVVYPAIKTRLAVNDPFPGAQTLYISGTPWGTFEQTRDTRVPYEEDPAKLATRGRAYATAFVWNLCAPASSREPNAAGQLRAIFRSIFPDVGTLKLSPVIATYPDAPKSLTGFPPRPAQPGCGPAPAPAPAEVEQEQGKDAIPWGKILGGLFTLWALSKGGG